MPLSVLKRALLGTHLLLLALTVFASDQARALEENRPLHHSAEFQLWNRRENKVELRGRAIVRQPGEMLTADTIYLDMNARTVHAKGNCVYTASDTVINGEEMKFNLDTRTGTIISGRVSNERFSLAGERINKLGASRFQTHWGEYSTCRDCPQSWAFQAEDVDLEIEGYAFLKNVTLKIKDSPGVWFPYLVVPIKTKRQSGLLFPTARFNDQHGFMFVLPFFWALDRSFDMTFGLGTFSSRGTRGEWEGRYSLSPRSNGTARAFYLTDRSEQSAPLRGAGAASATRWAFDFSLTQEMPWSIEGKARFIEVSDNLYPNFIGDVPGTNEPVVASDLIFSKTSSELSAFLAFRRMRNLLNTNPNASERVKQFDPHTVQKLPEAVVTTNSQFLFSSPVAASLTLGVSNFTRSAGPFDFAADAPLGASVPRPGIDPIREATRVAVTPNVYTTLRPFEVASLIPSATYYSYFYSFHNALPNLYPNLYRGYLLLQSELSTQIERFYDTGNPSYPKSKHLIRPFLLYSYIPYVREEPHPFLTQIETPGFNFDNRDLVPLDTSPSQINYFVPLGNSLSYGFTSQLIRRRGDPAEGTAAYQRSVELSARQAINFKRSDQRFSRLISRLGFEFDRWSWITDFTYTPYLEVPAETVTSSATYVFERAMKQRLLEYERSATLSYTYNKLSCTPGAPASECRGALDNLNGSLKFSLSDYVLPTFFLGYHFTRKEFMNIGLNVAFQSPSRCWKFAFGISHDFTTKTTRSFELVFNLTGSGFGGVSEIASELVAK